MPDWLSQLGFGAILAIIGWLIVNKLNGIDKKLDRYEERQTKIEKDCVTWADHEAMKLVVNGVDRRVTVLEATCQAERGK